MQDEAMKARHEKWLGEIMECRSSGIGTKSWCAQHGITERTFYKRCSRLVENGYDLPDGLGQGMKKQTGPVNTAEGSFIGFTAPAESHTAAASLRIGNTVLEISSSASPAFISSVIEALRKSC